MNPDSRTNDRLKIIEDMIPALLHMLVCPIPEDSYHIKLFNIIFLYLILNCYIHYRFFSIIFSLNYFSVNYKLNFLGCQTLKMAASRRAKALGAASKSVRIPRCNKQGGFEPIQCDNEIVSSCWCVDEAGFELAGTRAPDVTLVNCSGKSNFYFILLCSTNVSVYSSLAIDNIRL